MAHTKKKNPAQQKLRDLLENDNCYLDTMTGTNSSSDRFILRRNVEINSNEYFSCDVFFREWNLRPRGLETSLRNHQVKSVWVQSYFNDWLWFIERLSVKIFIYSSFVTIDDVILKKTFSHNGSAFFGEMCRSSSLVVNTSLEAPKLRLRQHRPSMSIKSFEETKAGGRSDKIRCPFAR